MVWGEGCACMCVGNVGGGWGGGVCFFWGGAMHMKICLSAFFFGFQSFHFCLDQLASVQTKGSES